MNISLVLEHTGWVVFWVMIGSAFMDMYFGSRSRRYERLATNPHMPHEKRMAFLDRSSHYNKLSLKCIIFRLVCIIIFPICFVMANHYKV